MVLEPESQWEEPRGVSESRQEPLNVVAVRSNREVSFQDWNIGLPSPRLKLSLIHLPKTRVTKKAGNEQQ